MESDYEVSYHSHGASCVHWLFTRRGNSEPFRQTDGVKYLTEFLIQVEAERPYHWIALSCTGFDRAERPIGETTVFVDKVPANQRVYKQEQTFWNDPATSVACRVIKTRVD